MSDILVSKTMPVFASARAEQLTLHLLRHPADLIDTRRLMQSFHASVAEVQQVLDWLEKHSHLDEEEAEG
jgi:ribosomal protein S15P/S13E